MREILFRGKWEDTEPTSRAEIFGGREKWKD